MEKKNDLIVRKNNNLVKARYSLTTIETKVFLLLLYKLQAVEKGVLICEIKRSEFKEIFLSSREHSVPGIKKILSSLRVKPIEFKVNNKWGEFGFINGFVYDDINDTFTIEASKKIYDVVQSYLEDGYTPNNLAVLFRVKNSYTFRLYDLLRLWSGNKNIIEYKVDELRELLMLEKKYPAYADFKKRVIRPAVLELNETGVLNVEESDRKKGRKVESIIFKVTDLDKRKGFNEHIKQKKQTLKNVENDTYENNNRDKIDETKTNNTETTDTVKRDKLDITSKYYIPAELDIVKSLEKKFEIEYKKYDFSLEENLLLLLDAQAIVKCRDNKDVIDDTNYKLFTTVLNKKLIDAEAFKIAERERKEEEYYYNKLTESERDDAFMLDRTCKEFYISIYGPDDEIENAI